MRPLSGLLVSTFNAGNLSRYLDASEDLPPVTTTSAPFGQLMQVLLAPPAAGTVDFSVVWSDLEQVSTAYARATEYGSFSADEIRADVDLFTAAVRTFSKRAGTVFVPTWTPVTPRPHSVLLGVRDSGAARLLMEMNLRLAASLEDVANVYVLDARSWLETGGRNAREPKLWYLAKVPFANDVFIAAARDIKACLRALHGRTRKLIILDLDDTLWGGLVGDVGWEQLRLGGHDGTGEAFVDFQRALKALSRRGVVLGIVSKNNQDVALEAVDRHPEMVLRRADFAGWRINWEDKARNIVDLVHELNLGLDSVVFIDDNRVERARIQEALPEVLVPDWPSDAMLYPAALAELRCFDQPEVTVEDTMRAGMYVSERQRQALLSRIGSTDEWLESLELQVVVDDIGPHNFDRALQLLNKTNQMNLATRRFDAAAFRDWLKGHDRHTWCLRVKDRLGDSGVTGLLSVEARDGVAEVRDFVLSCRVMGRKVEDTMLHLAVEHARATGLARVCVTFVPTARNRPCREFLEHAGFPERPSPDRFEWPTSQQCPLPSVISLSYASQSHEA